MLNFKEYANDKKVPKGYHKMPDGSIMKDDDMKEKAKVLDYGSDEAVAAALKLTPGQNVKEMGPAAMKRMKAKKAYLAKTMAKYGAASKMGMDPADVNQRRNKPTLKKR